MKRRAEAVAPVAEPPFMEFDPSVTYTASDGSEFTRGVWYGSVDGHLYMPMRDWDGERFVGWGG